LTIWWHYADARDGQARQDALVDSCLGLADNPSDGVFLWGVSANHEFLAGRPQAIENAQSVAEIATARQFPDGLCINWYLAGQSSSGRSTRQCIIGEWQ
jgi:hypothetical protein